MFTNMRTIIIVLLVLLSSNAFAVDANVTITWIANPTVDQVNEYDCQYGINSVPVLPCPGLAIPGSVTTANFTLKGLAVGDSVDVHIRACNVVGCSGFSASAGAFVPDSVPNVVPGTPVGLSINIK